VGGCISEYVAPGICGKGEAVALGILSTILIVISAFLICFLRKSSLHSWAAYDVWTRIQIIIKEYPDAVHSWGGKTVLDNVPTIQAIVDTLEASLPQTEGAMPSLK